MSQHVTVQDVINAVFSKPPQEPCTYQILMPVKYNKNDANSFQYLMGILVGGAKRLYGETIIPSAISNTQFKTLQKYMLSLGYQIKHNYTYNDQSDVPAMINIWFEPYLGRRDCHGGVVFVNN